MEIEYKREQISTDEFAEILQASGLAVRRPVGDLKRLKKCWKGRL